MDHFFITLFFTLVVYFIKPSRPTYSLSSTALIFCSSVYAISTIPPSAQPHHTMTVSKDFLYAISVLSSLIHLYCILLIVCILVLTLKFVTFLVHWGYNGFILVFRELFFIPYIFDQDVYPSAEDKIIPSSQKKWVVKIITL